MGVLHDKLTDVISKHYSVTELSERALRVAATKRGIPLSDDDVKSFVGICKEATIHKSSRDELSARLAESGLTATDINEALSELLSKADDRLGNAVPRIVDEIAPNILKSLYESAPGALAEWASMRRGFERRLRRTWRKPFDRLEMLITIARESGEQHLTDTLNSECQEFVKDSNALQLIDALVRLHARACRVASEIACLLRGGFADGAIARWRSLHEIAVIGMFLTQAKGDVPERYLAHGTVERFKRAKQYQQHSKALRQKPYSAKQMRKFESECNASVAKYGIAFKSEYGWASSALASKRPTFADIEENLDMDKWRPYYSMACSGVHAGSQSLFWSLGIPESSDLEVLAGASNTGLADPGHCTAISLT